MTTKQENKQTGDTPPEDTSESPRPSNTPPLNEELLRAQLANATYEQLEGFMRVAYRRGPDTFEKAALGLIFKTNSDESGEDEELVLWDSSDLIKHVGEPPPQLVDRLIPQNSLLLLAGKPKFGKSYLSLDLALAIAANRSVWGEFGINYVKNEDGTERRKVLYLAMEDGEIEIVNRLTKHGVRKDEPEDAPSRNVRWSVGVVDLSKPKTLLKLRGILAELKPALLIVDTAREGLRIVDWTNAAELTEKIRPWRELAREHCPIIMVAHNRKADGGDGDEIAGSNAFTSSVDGWISAVQKVSLENKNFRLKLSVQGRGDLKGEHWVEMDTETTKFRFVSEEEIAQSKTDAAENRRDEKLDLIRQTIIEIGGEATTKEIAAHLKKDYRTVHPDVQAALTGGYIINTGKKVSEGRGAPAAVYAPAEEHLFNSSSSPINKKKKDRRINNDGAGATGERFRRVEVDDNSDQAPPPTDDDIPPTEGETEEY